MTLLPEFEEIDFLFGHAPNQPFSHLAGIVFRVQSMLKNLTDRQIHSVLKILDAELVAYFEGLRTYAIDDLRAKFESDPEEYEYFFEWDGGTVATGMWLFRRELEEELDIETAENSSWVDALKSIIEERDACLNAPERDRDSNKRPWPECKDSELFAVLSLGLVACSVISVKRDGYPSNFSVAGACAIEAMDAVCYAEQCREIEWLEQFHSKQLLEASKSQIAKIQEVTANIGSLLRSEQNEHERLKRAERSAQMNAARHQPAKEARRLVLQDWDVNYRNFPSAEQAGIYYSDWLAKKSIGYLVKGHQEYFKPRAITEWIRQQAKARNIKLR